MKSKIFGLLSLSILSLVILSGLVSAASLSVDSDSIEFPDSINHDDGSFDIVFDLTNEGIEATTLDWENAGSQASQDATISFSQDTIGAGTDTDPNTETITATVNFASHKSGNIVVDIKGDADGVGGEFELDTIIVAILDSSELSVSSSEISQEETSTTITIKNEGNVDLTSITLTDSGDFEISFNQSEPFNLIAGATETIEVTMTTDADDLELGTNSVTITATSGDVSATGNVSIEKSFCDYDNKGELEINIKDISNDGFSNKKFGDDDEWFPLEEIEVEVEIENTGNHDIDDIEVVWGLYDEDAKEWIIEEEESDFNLADGKEKTLILNFKLDDVDEFENNGDYVFYVKATGKIDANDETYDGDDTCASDSERKNIIIESDFVVIDEVEFPETVQCGSEVQILADVWNIGDDDQDDIEIYVVNAELGINEKIEIDDINAFDNEKLEVTIKIPQGMDEKWYTLTFYVYDEDNDLYETDHDDDKAEFRIPIQVLGNCEVESTALVSPVLESGGKAGEKLVVKATITNTGNELVNYVLSATETDWASAVEFGETAIVLGAGESKDVLVTLDVNKDVSGDKVFNINVLNSDGELITKQPVSVLIEKSSGFNFEGLIQDNWYLWVIGAVNIILVIIIILVAVRVARK